MSCKERKKGRRGQGLAVDITQEKGTKINDKDYNGTRVKGTIFRPSPELKDKERVEDVD